MGITRPRPDGGVTRKAPGALPRRCSPSPQGVKCIMVTQATSSSLCSERRDEYLFGRGKSEVWGKWPPKKQKTGIRPHPDGGVKMVITTPRPDGGVKKFDLLSPNTVYEIQQQFRCCQESCCFENFQ